MFSEEGPLRKLLKGQSIREYPLRELERFERQSLDQLPGEQEANMNYRKLAQFARELGLEDLALKYDEIAKDEADHHRIIRSEILPKINQLERQSSRD